MMKTNFNRLCLLMTICLLLFSCRHDELQQIEEYNNSSKFRLITKKISLEKSKDKAALMVELDKTASILKNGKLKNKAGLVEMNDFTIDTDNIIYFENGIDYHAYTFYIKRENAGKNAPLENLVLSPLTDGTYKAFIVTYYLTEEEKKIVLNGGYVNTKGKTSVTLLSNQINIGILNKGSGCYYETVTTYVTCASGDHLPGEGGCTLQGNQRAYISQSIQEVCNNGEENPTGGAGNDNDNPNTGGNSAPCAPSSNGILTGPQVPNMDTSLCGGGVPTLPNLPDFPDTEEEPCEKTKRIYTNLAVKSRYDVLKTKTSEPKESGYGFKTVPDGMGGTTTETTPLTPDSTSPDKMRASISSTSYGYIHTHLDKKDGTSAVKIFSPADINAFLSFLHNAVTYGIPLNNIFGGMIASDGGTDHNIYQMTYNGDGTDLPPEFTDEQLEELKNEYIRLAQRIMNENDGILSHSDMQKIFYTILKKMNIKNVVLSKIDYKTTTYRTVNFDSKGNPTEETCS